MALNHTITAERSEPSPPQEKHHVAGRNNASRSLHCRGVILALLLHLSVEQPSVWHALHFSRTFTYAVDIFIYFCLVTSLLNLMNNITNNNNKYKKNQYNKLIFILLYEKSKTLHSDVSDGNTMVF